MAVTLYFYGRLALKQRQLIWSPLFVLQGEPAMWHKLSSMILATVLVCCTTVTRAVTIDTVPVGNPGNAGELSGAGAGGYGPDRICGAVGYTYNIGKYEVTAGQYCAFLNAVAKTDAYDLYHAFMDSSSYGCKIRQLGTSGSYTYLVDANGDGVEDADWVKRPVNYVSWGAAARFANWLHNGQPTTGAQDSTTTEDGSYYLNGAITSLALIAVTRKPGATWVIPTEDEWYKAAYYDPNKGGAGVAGYYDYATKSDTPPINTLLNPDPGNHANFNSWRTIGSPYYRTEVGAFSNSASAYGTFDQAGNLFELNDTVYGRYYRGVRGGSWDSDSISLLASLHDESGLFANGHSSSVGFRVAFVPEPGSITLLVAGAISLLAYAWRRRAAL
jgi:formylglycine-generating enzyme